MKKLGVWLALVLVLSGCSDSNDEIDMAMALRSRLLKSAAVTFDARVTADYGEEIHQFSMACSVDTVGNLNFTVTAPDSISGITGSIRDMGGQLTFDDTALHFPLMAEEQLTPVSAPWIFMKTLRSGYLTSAGMDGELIRLSIDDSYEDNALHLDIWMDQESVPVRGEILYDGRRILTVAVGNFRIS